MTTRVTFTHYYPGRHERLTAHAFDTQIGKQWPLVIEGRPHGQATLVSAEVIEDGWAATLTVDFDDPDITSLLGPALLGVSADCWPYG